MSSEEHLYRLLPAIYRRTDAENGEPLRALLSVVDGELEAVRADTETTWDNWFLETAEEWLVPYLASALGVPLMQDVEAVAFSRRAFVANTIGYRRRKGTVGMIELFARNVSNYPTRAVEFMHRIAVTEAINHTTGTAATVDLRSTARLARLTGPLSAVPRAVDVRRIASGRGRYNLPNLGLFMWRPQLWRLEGAAAPASGEPRAFFMRPTGGAAPLYAPLASESDPTALADETSLPVPLSRRRLYADRQRAGNSMSWPFAITIEGTGGAGRERRVVPPDAIEVCHLEPMRTPPTGNAVSIDPEIGAVLLGDGIATDLSDLSVFTTHFIATPGEVGAGPWARRGPSEWLSRVAVPPRNVDFQVMVSGTETGPEATPTLDEAVNRWHAFLDAQPAGAAPTTGLILIADSGTYAAPTTPVRVPGGASLGIIAATWPDVPDPGGGPGRVRLPGDLLADEVRPLITGTLTIDAGSAEAELIVDGLLMEEGIALGAGAVRALTLSAVTLLGADGLTVEAADGVNAALEVAVVRSALGAVRANGPIASLHATDTAVLGPLTAPDSALSTNGVTVLGRVTAGRIEATDCVFEGPLAIDAQQTGCIRFSYVAPESRTPQRYRCQPDLALDAASASDEAAVLRTVRPQFQATDPLAPGFLLFTDNVPAAITRGAEDSGEMGCWNHLQHAARVANLEAALPQFLRFGLEPGLFFLT